MQGSSDAAQGQRRYFPHPKTGDPLLGPLQLLPGTWKGVGTGWNMIALPFQGGPSHYRILMNQYDETLKFTFVDDDVPNRGLAGVVDNSSTTDQLLVALDYLQVINQVVADDFPKSGLAGKPGLGIHHEPGQFLHMKNLNAVDKDVTGDAKLSVARLSSIPHGNAVLAIGTDAKTDGPPTIPRINGVVLGRFDPVGVDKYLDPYKHYIDSPFMGNVNPAAVPGFPGFHPLDMNAILRFANEGVDIARTTTLSFDTQRREGGIRNIPFGVKQAEATSMKATFWIQELKEKDRHGHPKLRLQYSQIVMLDFFQPRVDAHPGRARWPHISINTLEREEGSADYA